MAEVFLKANTKTLYYFGIKAYSQGTTGTASASINYLQWQLEVDQVGSTNAPTATGQAEVGIDKDPYAYGALVTAPGNANGAATVDALSASITVTTPGSNSNENALGYPFYIDGSSLTWKQDNDGTWVGTYTFLSDTGTCWGNLTGHGEGEGIVTITNEGIVSNTIKVANQ